MDFTAKVWKHKQTKHHDFEAVFVCCLIGYNVLNSWFQIKSYWLPLLRRVFPEDHRRPVILVGNKSDMLEVSCMEVRVTGYCIMEKNIIM